MASPSAARRDGEIFCHMEGNLDDRQVNVLRGVAAAWLSADAAAIKKAVERGELVAVRT